MLLSDLFAQVLPKVFSYGDEFFSLVCATFLLANVIKTKKIKKYHLLFLLVVFIGCMGNAIWGVRDNIATIISDMFVFTKIYIILMYSDIVISQRVAHDVYEAMINISEIFLLLLTAFSLITLVVPLDMTVGHGSFRFFCGYAGVVAWWTTLFMAVIYGGCPQKRFRYWVMATIAIIRTGSGFGLLAIALVPLVYLFIEKQKKFKWYYAILAVPFVLFIARNEISEYLLNGRAPRFLLFYYAFVTAIRYFPLGSGFSTYGSVQALRYYSPLYTKYGFSHMYGMTQDTSKGTALLDTYYPQVIAQTGIVATAIYIKYMYTIVQKMILTINNAALKYGSLYLMICWLIAGLGFSTASAWGSTVFFLFPIFSKVDTGDIK